MRIFLTAFSNDLLRSDVISAEELGINPEKPGTVIYLPLLQRISPVQMSESAQLSVPYEPRIKAARFDVVRIEQYGPSLEQRYAHYRLAGFE